MKKTVWWKVAVIAVLGIAVIGVMQLKARQAAADRTGQDIVATSPVTDETSSPTPAPTMHTEATPSTNAPTPKAPATTSNTSVNVPTTPKTAATGNTVKENPTTANTATPPPAPQPAPVKAVPVKAVPVKKATFIELGADQCVPCKMMQPVMEELRKEHADTLTVIFYDVWKDPTMGDKYGVRSIPTQVLLDGDGKEVFRHVGFWPKDDIVAKYKELGITL